MLNEREQLLLRRAAFDATVTRAAKHGDSVLGKALAKIVGLTSGDYIRQVIDTVLGKRAELARMVAYHGSGADWSEAECQALKRLFGVAEQAEDALIEQLADVLTNQEIDDAVSDLAKFASGARDNDAEAALRAARSSTGERRVTALTLAFLTQDGKPRAQVCSKAVAKGRAVDLRASRPCASRLRRSHRQARAFAPVRSERGGARSRRRREGRLRATQAGRSRARL